jgi:hypothetical protein
LKRANKVADLAFRRRDKTTQRETKKTPRQREETEML